MLFRGSCTQTCSSDSTAGTSRLYHLIFFVGVICIILAALAFSSSTPVIVIHLLCLHFRFMILVFARLIDQRVAIFADLLDQKLALGQLLERSEIILRFGCLLGGSEVAHLELVFDLAIAKLAAILLPNDVILAQASLVIRCLLRALLLELTSIELCKAFVSWAPW